MTAVLPRPPVSSQDVAALVDDLDPENPETQELLDRARQHDQDRETMVRCPACKDCPCCGIGGVTTPTRASAYLSEETDGPDDSHEH